MPRRLDRNYVCNDINATWAGNHLPFVLHKTSNTITIDKLGLLWPFCIILLKRGIYKSMLYRRPDLHNDWLNWYPSNICDDKIALKNTFRSPKTSMAHVLMQAKPQCFIAYSYMRETRTVLSNKTGFRTIYVVLTIKYGCTFVCKDITYIQQCVKKCYKVNDIIYTCKC